MLDPQLRARRLGESVQHLADQPPPETIVDRQRTRHHVEHRVRQPIAHGRQRAVEAQQASVATQAGEFGAQRLGPRARQATQRVLDRQAGADRVAQLLDRFDQRVLDRRAAAVVAADVVGVRRQQPQPADQPAHGAPAGEQLRHQRRHTTRGDREQTEVARGDVVQAGADQELTRGVQPQRPEQPLARPHQAVEREVHAASQGQGQEEGDHGVGARVVLPLSRGGVTQGVT